MRALGTALTLGTGLTLGMMLTLAPAVAQKGPSASPQAADPITGVTLDMMEDGAGGQLALDGMAITVHARANGDDTTTPVFTVTHESGASLTFDGEASLFDFLPVTLQIAPLDLANPMPAVIATSYTGGAHCCTVIDVIVWDAVQSALTRVELGPFDGGYVVEDANGDGVGEIVVSDQSFLYTFDAYAGSWPPPVYLAVHGADVIDVSADPSFIPAFDAAMEDIDPADYSDRPGMLAGWAALEARQGRGEAALARLAQVDVETFFEFTICADGTLGYDCPGKGAREATFVEALRAHLFSYGYLEADQ